MYLLKLFTNMYFKSSTTLTMDDRTTSGDKITQSIYSYAILTAIEHTLTRVHNPKVLASCSIVSLAEFSLFIATYKLVRLTTKVIFPVHGDTAAAQ